MMTGHGPRPSGNESEAASRMPSGARMYASSVRGIARSLPLDPAVEPHQRPPMQVADLSRGQDRPEQPEHDRRRGEVDPDERAVDVGGRDGGAAVLLVSADLAGTGFRRHQP